MLGNQPFYFGTLRKIVVVVGSIFNDIVIEQVDANGNVTGNHKVPLSYAPKSIYLEKLKTDHGIEKSLPAMSYEINGSLEYDMSRQRNQLNSIHAPNPNPTALPNTTTGNLGTQLKQFMGVPYNIPFTVSIFSSTIEDSLRIVEQIIPFFSPSYNVPAKIMNELGITEDLKIILESAQYEDSYSEGFEHNRLIEWTLSLTVKASFYPPIKPSAEIKKSTVTTTQDFNMVQKLESIGVAVVPPTASKTDPYTISTTIA